MSSISQQEAQRILADRRQELARLKEVKKLTSELAGKFEQFDEQMKKVNEGSATVAEVTDNWNQIIRAVGLAANSMVTAKDGGKLTERLVRVKMDGDKIE